MYVRWSDLEPVLPAVAGWRRRGRAWSGPCPVTGAGTDTCWMHPGPGDIVRGGCRRCHPMGRDGFRAHLAALATAGGAVAPAAAVVGVPSVSTVPVPPYSFADVWDAAGPLAPDGPGQHYLGQVRGCRAFGDWPPAVRFLGLGSAVELGVRPALPLGAAGALLYGYRAVGEADYLALQLEALAPDGARIPFRRYRANRVSVFGSVFRGGRRFDARTVDAGGVVLVEGPVSALSVVLRFPRLGSGWTVAGVAGWSGFTPAAVGSASRVLLCPDGDPDGRAAVARLASKLSASGRAVTVLDVPDGADVADLWRTSGATEWSPGADG